MRVFIAAVFLLSTTFEFTLGACVGQTVVLTNSEGTIASPSPGEVGVCAWTIRVPTHLRIIFYFTQYNLESFNRSYPEEHCLELDTRIELKDGPMDPSWRTYCQSGMPEPIATNSSSLYVKLNLSREDSKSVFSARYITLPFKHTIDLRHTSNAVIFSPNFPGKYPRNSYFVWSVVGPSGFRIKIEFTKFDISDRGGSGCSYDALVVRDGPTGQGEVLARLCGKELSRNAKAVYSSTNSLTLEFVSALYGHYENDNIGFKATVSKDIKLYVIIVPCAVGILVVSFLVAAVVFKYRRRSSSGVGQPRMQMSLLNEVDHFSTTQISDVDTPNEANLPVYRPTTEQIKKT